MIQAEKLAKVFIGLGLVKVVPAFTAAPESVIVPVSQDNVQRLEITVDSYAFTPIRFVVKQNIPVELIFKSVSWVVPHNFVVALGSGPPLKVNLPVTVNPKRVGDCRQQTVEEGPSSQRIKAEGERMNFFILHPLTKRALHQGPF